MMQIEMVQAGSLVMADYNPRQISESQFEKLRKSIREFGFVEPVIVNRHPGRENVIVGGHMRVRAAIAEGITEVPVYFVDLDPVKERLLNIALNRISGEWDKEKLSEMIYKLNEDGADLALTGFEDVEVTRLIDEVANASGEAEEETAAEEPPKEPISKLGEIYELGPHRLMCGDSTNPEHVAKLLSGECADMVFTDPPWNVDYGGGVEAGNAQGYKVRTILNDNMTPEKWKEFLDGFVKSLKDNTKAGAPIYLVMSAQEWPTIDDALRRGGFHWSSTIIWAKDRLVLSRKDYHTQYEPLWYGWNDAGPRRVEVEDRTQSDVWQIDRPSSSPDHPTTKPLALLARAIMNSSKRGDVILDLFGGSGSTLIAAGNIGRRAFLMELDPGYCDVIRKRWEKSQQTP